MDSQGGRTSRRPRRRRRQLVSLLGRGTSRSSSDRSPLPAALGSCCPPVWKGTHTMSGTRRRADDPMVLKIYTDESKLKIDWERKKCQMTVESENLELVIQKIWRSIQSKRFIKYHIRSYWVVEVFIWLHKVV